MEEVENISVTEDVATPQETESQNVQETPKETPVYDDKQERNWREMRKQYNELKEIAKTQAALIEQMKVSQQVQKQEVPDEFDSISDDDYIPKGKVKKLLQKESESFRKAAREEAERLLQEKEKSRFMDRLKSQFSDFDDVVNSETLSLLEEHDPDLAKTIAETQDPYKIGLQSYKYIKALNLSEKAPQARRVKEVEKNLEKNSKTVLSPQAYEKRPMAQAFRMSEAEKNKLYEEMMQCARQSGLGY